jgi:ankyrin repeat protein
MRRRHIALLILLLLTSLIAALVVLTWREVRQEQLNHALIAAVDRNDAANVRRLLRQGADPNAQVLVDDKPPVWKQFWDTLRFRSDPAFAPRMTALAAAITWNSHYDATKDHTIPDGDNADTVKALANAGADVNAGFTRVWSYGTFGTERLRTTPLIEAAANGKWKVMQVLLACHADVHATDGYGNTALMYAVLDWNTGMVKRLVKGGAEVNVKDDNGETALFWAFDWAEPQRHAPMTVICRMYQNPDPNMQEIVKFLLRSRAAVHGISCRGTKIMSLARRWGDKRLIQMLVQAGAR